MEEILQELMLHPVNIASADISILVLQNEPFYNFDRKEATYITSVMSPAIEKIADSMAGHLEPGQGIKDLEPDALKGFIYFFDKAIEVVYNIRSKSNNEIHFNSDDLYYGMGGDKVPEYIQLKITPYIPKVGLIFQNTFDIIFKNDDLAAIKTSEVLKSLLYGSMYLGIRFCLRIDFDNYSEWNRLMESE